MDQPIFAPSRRHFDSQGELAEFFRSSGVPSEMVGTSAEAPSAYYCFEVRQGEQLLAYVGLISDGLGIAPSWIIKDSKLLIGFDMSVAVFSWPSIKDGREIPLDSVFYAFLPMEGHPHVCVIAETTVFGMLPDGSIIWAADAYDVIGDYRVLDNVMEAELMESGKIRIDLVSGKKRVLR